SIGHTIGYVLTVIAVSIVLLLIDWRLALVVLVPLPLISFAVWLYSRRYQLRTRQLQEAWADTATLAEETVSGIRVVKGLGAGDEPVLDALDLRVPAGESLALVGSTGSGKSTIAGLLARLYDPDGGRVLLDGHDVREVRLGDVRQAVALVFEDTFLFTDTVRENIRFGRPDASDEDVATAAALAGAAEFVEDLPDGYDTVLG